MVLVCCSPAVDGILLRWRVFESPYSLTQYALKSYTIELHGLQVVIQHKRIKNINLAIYPPDGRIRVSAPLRLGEEAIRSVILARLPWIRRKRAALLARPVQVVPQLVSGETLCCLGDIYRLTVVEHNGAPAIRIAGDLLELTVRHGTSSEKKASILNEWYRGRLRERIPELLARWQPVVGVQVEEFRIRRMKSRWGTCNIRDRHICLNLELARLPHPCLEYVVVHELTHLLERYHNARFWSLMDQFLPQWREARLLLRQAQIS